MSSQNVEPKVVRVVDDDLQEVNAIADAYNNLPATTTLGDQMLKLELRARLEMVIANMSRKIPGLGLYIHAHKMLVQINKDVKRNFRGD